MPDDRLYTEKEISAILNRAGEMQAEQSPEQTHGLSLAELQQIAAEVGLDPRLVAAAASEFDSPVVATEADSWPSIPTTVRLTRVAPGEVGEGDWAELSGEIGRTFGVVGASGQVGQAFEWTHTSERVQLQVRLTPDRGQTRIDVLGDFSKVVAARIWARLIWVIQALVLGVAWPLGAGVSLPGSVAIGLSAAVLLYMAIHFGFSAWVGKKERAARDLVKRLERRIGETGTRDAPVPEATQGRIALPDDETMSPVEQPEKRRLRERG